MNILEFTATDVEDFHVSERGPKVSESGDDGVVYFEVNQAGKDLACNLEIVQP